MSAVWLSFSQLWASALVCSISQCCYRALFSPRSGRRSRLIKTAAPSANSCHGGACVGRSPPWLQSGRSKQVEKPIGNGRRVHSSFDLPTCFHRTGLRNLVACLRERPMVSSPASSLLQYLLG